MLKTLLKKQMLEIFRSFFYDARKGKNRTKKGAILYITFYALLMVGYLGGLFGFLAHSIAFPLANAGLGWLYFLIMGGIALILGVFGSVFSTYSSLYMAKDNDLLLSMPIPVSHILASRLMGVFLTGLMYSAVVLVPAIWFPRHRKMKPFPAPASQEKSHVRTWRSKRYLAPLMRPTKFPSIPVSLERTPSFSGTTSSDPLLPFYLPDLDRRVDSPALSGMASPTSGRTSG